VKLCFLNAAIIVLAAENQGLFFKSHSDNTVKRLINELTVDTKIQVLEKMKLSFLFIFRSLVQRYRG
jgi:hypothetical protein